MLSTPWSLGFVLAAILGAMLVPGCRPYGLSEPSVSAVTPTPRLSSSQIVPDQINQAERRFKALAAEE